MADCYKGEIHRSRMDRLLELVDGAKPLIEVWKAEFQAQAEWQKRWIASASEELKFAEEHKCQHQYWFRCKCGRPVCSKCEQEYEDDIS